MINGFIPVKEYEFDGSITNIPQNQLRDYNIRVIRSGDVVEIYNYDNKVHYNYEKIERHASIKEKTENWAGKSEDSLRRSRREIRRVIWCNLNRHSKFLTLTYAENMQDLEKFYYDWKMFTKSMSRKGYKLDYLYVLEYQERGAIHAHVIIFNDEYIPWETITDCWKHGVIDIHKIRDIGNLGAYVCKYLTKETLSEYNSKSYHCSQGLKRPIERKITLEESANLLQELFAKGEVVYSSKYDVLVNDIVTNKVEYSQIKMQHNVNTMTTHC
jgi:hypothetical protein